jgi:type II secretory pathway pseudopilin PulG
MLRGHEIGSSLIEVLVAMLVLVSGLLAMAQLFVVAVATNAGARFTTVAATLVAQKIEHLRGDMQLQPSPLAALERNTHGFVDHVDRFGHIVGSSEAPAPGAVYTRRWSIEPVLAGSDTLVIHVLVGRSERLVHNDRAAAEAEIVTIRTRGRR